MERRQQAYRERYSQGQHGPLARFVLHLFADGQYKDEQAALQTKVLDDVEPDIAKPSSPPTLREILRSFDKVNMPLPLSWRLLGYALETAEYASDRLQSWRQFAPVPSGLQGFAVQNTPEQQALVQQVVDQAETSSN